MFLRSVPDVKSTLIKARCGSDTPPAIPDDKSVIELREESYDCSGRTESKAIDRLTQPPKQHHTAISVATLSPAARFGRLKSGALYVTCLSSSSGPAVRAPALAGRRRPRGATPRRLADSVRCHILWQPIQTGTPSRESALFLDLTIISILGAISRYRQNAFAIRSCSSVRHSILKVEHVRIVWRNNQDITQPDRLLLPLSIDPCRNAARIRFTDHNSFPGDLLFLGAQGAEPPCGVGLTPPPYSRSSILPPHPIDTPQAGRPWRRCSPHRQTAPIGPRVSP
jgi:hypothetical protein